MSDSKKQVVIKDIESSPLTFDITSNTLTSFDVRTLANTVSLGNMSAKQQEFGAIAIGRGAGHGGQDRNAIAIGRVSAQFGKQGQSAIAIGHNTAQLNQAEKAIAIGLSAGGNSQAIHAIAIGALAGANIQGANSIALGHLAGFPIQEESSIVLNATGSNLEAKANSFVVKPVRQKQGDSVLFYESATGEITYSNKNVLCKVTTEELSDSNSIINQIKVDGLMVFNSTNKTVYISDENIWYSIKDNSTI